MSDQVVAEELEPTEDHVPEDEEQIDPFSLFSDAIRIPVRGLAYIGHITKTVDFCGHTFTLRTLRPTEKAAISIAIAPWRDTIAEPEVWANAQVAMSLEAVDSDADFCPPIGPSITEFAKARLKYVTDADSGWYQPTLSFLYTTLLALEAEALQAIKELQDLSERNRPQSQPSPDSLIVPGTSDVPAFMDIQH